MKVAGLLLVMAACGGQPKSIARPANDPAPDAGRSYDFPYEPDLPDFGDAHTFAPSIMFTDDPMTSIGTGSCLPP